MITKVKNYDEIKSTQTDIKQKLQQKMLTGTSTLTLPNAESLKSLQSIEDRNLRALKLKQVYSEKWLHGRLILEYHQKEKMKYLMSTKAWESINPALSSAMNPIIEIYNDGLKEIDTGYMAAFKQIDLTQSNKAYYDIYNLSGTAITFYTRVDGEVLKMSPLPTASSTSMTFIEKTGGVTVPDRWERFNDLYRLEEVFNSAEVGFQHMKSVFHYDLLTDVSHAEENFDTNDATTWNNACANIIDTLRDGNQGKDYPIETEPKFLLYYSHALKIRAIKAFLQSYQSPNDNMSESQIGYNIVPIMSTIVPKDHFYIVLPERQIRSVTWEDLNLYDEKSFKSTDYVWTSLFNAGVYETNQIRRCKLS